MGRRHTRPYARKRTPLRWIGYKMEYKITRAGWIYILARCSVALAALNTGNNLPFSDPCVSYLRHPMSGILSSVCSRRRSLDLEMPEHIFAGQPAERATVEQKKNEKLTVPSFSLTVEAVTPKKSDAATAMPPVEGLFPYLPRQEALRPARPGHVSAAWCSTGRTRFASSRDSLSAFCKKRAALN